MERQKQIAVAINELLEDLKGVTGGAYDFAVSTSPDLDLGEDVMIVSWAREPDYDTLKKVVMGEGYRIMNNWKPKFDELNVKVVSNFMGG